MNGRPTFQRLAARLVRYLNELVRRGEITERGLARVTGYSQPHIHNVLKGARGLNPELGDQIMERLAIPLLSLFTQDELSGLAPPPSTPALAVPVFPGRLGGGNPFPILSGAAEQQLLPSSKVAQLVSPVLAFLDADERSMWPAIWPNDLILLDRCPGERRKPSFHHVYALAWQGQGFIGRCRRVGQALVVVMDNAREAGGGVSPIPLAGLDVLDIVKGRIVWLGRDL